MTTGKINVQTENIFPIIKKFLYSDHEIFLRELVANAVDATGKIKTLTSIGENKTELGELSVEIIIDKENKTLTIRDRGLGMTAEEVEKYINQIAFSGAEEFVNKYKYQNIFGISSSLIFSKYKKNTLKSALVKINKGKAPLNKMNSFKVKTVSVLLNMNQ